MFCPNCGANNSTEQKFCRSCGLNLEKTAESMLEQIPSAESANLLKQERWLENFGNVAFGGFGLVLLAAVSAIIYTIFTKFILNGSSVLAGILLIAYFVFGILTVMYILFNESLKEKKQKHKLQAEIGITEKKDTAKLLEEKFFEPVPSITENSTELLHAKNKTQKLR